MNYFLYSTGFLVLLLYVLALVYVIYGFIRLKREKKNSDGVPQGISVVIAARNESKNIGACLISLIHQKYNATNFEVIVVDDHSTDETRLIVEQLINTTSISISIYQLSTNQFSKKTALKEGIKYAKYSIIATTDADCVLPPNWLTIITNNLKGGVAMLLGPVIFSDDEGFLGAFQFLDMCALQGITFGLAYYHNPILNNGANLAYLKKTYSEVGGYDDYKTPSGDDIFLLEKFKSLKQTVVGVLNKEFTVTTLSESSWGNLFHQRMRWASKASYYKDKWLLFFSGLIFIQNFVVVFIYIEMLFVEEMSHTGIILIMGKWLIDFILLFLLSSFFNKRERLIYFIPVQVLYPIYIVLVGIVSRSYKFKWKNRILNE